MNEMDIKRNEVVALHLAGKTNAQIVRDLKVNKKFVSRTIQRYKITGSTAKRYGGGRRKTATAQAMIEKVLEAIERDPKQSARKMAAELKISERSMQRILQDQQFQRIPQTEALDNDDNQLTTKAIDPKRSIEKQKTFSESQREMGNQNGQS